MSSWKTAVWPQQEGQLFPKELQVEANPNLPRGSLVEQEATCDGSLVFKLFLYGCHRNLRPTQDDWRWGREKKIKKNKKSS